MSKQDKERVELATKIANKSKKFVKTYARFEEKLFKIFRWFSSSLDKVLFSPRYGKSISFLLAIILFVGINYSSDKALFSTLQSSRDKNGVSIKLLYNEESFEVIGVPSSVNITITGDAASVNSAYNSSGTIVANLESLTEGTHNVKLTAQGFGENVSVKIDPSNLQLTLLKKTTRQFDVGYDYINLSKMDAIYSPGVPEFEYAKVNVRASKETLDTIAFVKALIDVSGQTSDFEKDATIVVYDKNGLPVNADIIPNTIRVKVPVTSPNKTVPIVVQTVGSMPNNLSIENIQMDQQTVTIYGADSVLSKISQVVVSIDVSTIDKNTTLLRPITLPTGVNSASVNQITMDVTIGESVTKTIDNVTISYRNNVNKYRFAADNDKVTTSVDVIGTQSNVDKITANDIHVYFDMSQATLGPQEFQLVVEQPTSAYVRYELKDKVYKGVVIGESVDQSGSQEVGGTE